MITEAKKELNDFILAMKTEDGYNISSLIRNRIVSKFGQILSQQQEQGEKATEDVWESIQKTGDYKLLRDSEKGVLPDEIVGGAAHMVGDWNRSGLVSHDDGSTILSKLIDFLHKHSPPPRTVEIDSDCEIKAEESYREVKDTMPFGDEEYHYIQGFIHGANNSNFSCKFFQLDPTTSSATKCICGREKFEHCKATGRGSLIHPLQRTHEKPERMKAEITNENKQKFFALYLFQWVYKSLQYDGCDELIPLRGIDSVHPKDYLRLTPLSMISDEDAKGFMAVMKTSPKEAGFDCSWQKLQKDLSECDPADQMGTIYLMDFYGWILEGIDFLRSRGYALPWMGLSVEEMVEAGWIKLVEPNKE